ncbi:dihydropteroate synthase [Verrucomicrobiales bacterium BCK34]|nr:dihydropteroate synthase [Verrucomicrobiales bacterium BCK34]
MKWRCADHTFDFSKRGEIMGILNVTPDSFSDGGRYDSVSAAVERALILISEGAAIIDIGGESTRPGAPEVSGKEECSRVIPVIEALTRSNPEVIISIDTSKPEVAEKAIDAGAKIINDVTGFRDPEMIALAAKTGAGLVVMHMQGTPRTMQAAPVYDDVVAEIRTFFSERHASFIEAGVAPEAIVYDPGIGFGKTQEHNLTLLKHLDQLTVEGRPLLLGVSRKSFIGKAIGSDSIEDREWPTVAITSHARELGVPLHRVHSVKPNFEALRMTEAMLK